MAGLGDNIRGANEEIQSLYEQLRGVTSEIKGQATEIGKTRAAFRAFEKGAQDLKLQYEEVNRLSDDQVKKLHEQLIEQKAIAAQEVQRLKSQNSYIQNLDEQIALKKEQGVADQELADFALQQIQNAQDLTDEQKAILSSFYDQTNVMDDIIGQAQAELSVREDVNNAMGVTGGILKGLNEIGGSFTKAFKLDKVKDDMEKFADETIRSQGSVSRLAVLGKGLQSAFTNAFKTLTDPAVIIAGLIKGFKEVDKQAVEFQRMTGQDINSFATSIDSANTHFITMADYIKTANELTKELGQNATAIFSPEDLMEAAEMTEAMGMQSKESAKLAQFSKINGGNIKAQNEAIVKGVNASNRQNKTAVAAGQILKDVANVSEEIAISYAGYPEKLGEAATAAAALGMTLGDIDKIAGSLLQFEQSIANELEAELLTGQDLNLEKARELALMNDLEGVAKELANQGITSASYSKMNRIQQEAQAKALGMSRQDMAKMLLAQEMANGLSEDALNDAQKQTLEQLKQEEAAEKFNKAIEKIQQSFAPIIDILADILSPILGMVSYLLQFKVVAWSLVPILALWGIAKLAKGFKSMKDSVKEGRDMLKDWGKSLLGMGDKTKGAGDAVKKGGDKAKEAAGKAADGGAGGVAESADKTKNVKGNKGKEIEQFLKGLGRGLKFIGQNFANVFKGGIALLLASPGLVGLSIAGPGLSLLGKVPGKGIETNLKGIARGLTAFAKPQVLQGSLYLIPAALGFAAMTAGAVGLAAIAVFGALAGAGLSGLGTGLTAFAQAMAIQTPIGPVMLIAPAALALLGAAMIPFAFALNLAAPAIEAIGTVINAVFTGIGTIITSVAEAFTMLLDSITMEKALALPLLGLGLVALAAGVMAMAITLPFLPFAALGIWLLSWALEPLLETLAEAGPGLEALSGSLTSMTSTISSLYGVADGLEAISDGLYSMAFAGFLAMPVIAGLTALGAVSGALNSIFGGGDSNESKKDEGSMKAVEEKLDQLIAVVSAGGDVYIDGTKVGKTLQLASSKMG